MIKTEEKVLRGYQAALEKKAHDLIIFDLRGISDLADYFLICSGQSDKQVRAIAEEIETSLLELGQTLDHGEGYREATWILLDYLDVIIHIFTEEKRRYYDLERLWGDAPIVEPSTMGHKEEEIKKETAQEVILETAKNLTS